MQEYLAVFVCRSFVMKSVVLGVALSLMASTAFAASGDVYSCKSIATAAAEEWTNGQVRLSEEMENTDMAQVVVISYGRKFLVPRYLPHNSNGKLPALGELTGEYDRVYSQELRRCLDIRDHKYSLD
jgi:hypothetical protein